MNPLNHLMNYSAELAQTPAFTSKNIYSRSLMATAAPIEFIAVLENAIKLPFQATTVIIKIPAKLINVVINSTSLKEFESKLSTPLNVLKTTLKIVGYAVGFFFTMSLGILRPYENFQLHCAFGLVTNQKTEKMHLLAEENKQKEIENYEGMLEKRLKVIVDTMRQQKNPPKLLNPEQRQDIQNQTKIDCPSIEEVVLNPILNEATIEKELDTENLLPTSQIVIGPLPIEDKGDLILNPQRVESVA